MKKFLTALVLSTALSVASSQNFFSYPTDDKDDLKELVIDFFGTLNSLRQFNFIKTWDLYRNLDFTFSVQFNYDVEFNPVKMNKISIDTSFLLQYNF